MIGKLRDLIHKKYVGAAVGTLAAAAALAAVAGVGMCIETGASPGASLEYFTRQHHRGGIEGHIRDDIETRERLEDLSASSGSMFHRAGFVYLNDEGLKFYEHKSKHDQKAQERLTINQDVHPRLRVAYLTDDTDGVIGILQERTSQGVMAQHDLVDDFRRHVERFLQDEKDTAVRHFKLGAHRFITLFDPTRGRPAPLGFVEKLRFHDQQDPEGLYVGTFESYGISGIGRGIVDEEYSLDMGESDHHIALVRYPDGTMHVRDFYDGLETSFHWNLDEDNGPTIRFRQHR